VIAKAKDAEVNKLRQAADTARKTAAAAAFFAAFSMLVGARFSPLSRPPRIPRGSGVSL
jgi:hypothetical protein